MTKIKISSKIFIRLVIYQSQNIENALLMYKMGFDTSNLAYIVRGNVSMINYLKIILIKFSSFLQRIFDVKSKGVILLINNLFA